MASAMFTWIMPEKTGETDRSPRDLKEVTSY